MRLRTIKPGFFKNEDLAALTPLARLLYAGLWCMADREGRLEDRPKRIKAELLPYESADIPKLLDALCGAGFVARYEAGGCKYLWIPNFRKHQSPHMKEQASTIPAPDMHGASTILAQQSLGSGIQSLGSTIPTPPAAGVSFEESSEKSNGSGHYAPRHPSALLLADFHARAVKHWKSDAKVNKESERSLRGFDALLGTDGRDFGRTKEILTWFFRGQPGDYEPRGDFDWRPNLLSGDSLRRAWDKLDVLFTHALEAVDEPPRFRR